MSSAEEETKPTDDAVVEQKSNKEKEDESEENVDKEEDRSEAAEALKSLTSPSVTAGTKNKEEAGKAAAAASASEDEEDDDAPLDAAEDFKIPLKLTKSGRKRATPFPLKLMKVLSNKEFADIVAWTPTGKAFNILQPKVFTANILPEHFKQAKYSSFTRKLHRWGFMRHYRGPEAGAFFHKNFRRGRLDLVEKMTCAKPGAAPKTGGGRARASAAAADNAPAMNMIMDTSASSRDGRNSALMGGMMGHHLGISQLSAGGSGFNGLMQQQGGLQQQLLMQQFGGMTAAQQQMLAQQQQMQQAQLQQQQMQAQGGGSSGDPGLDAAIEMEVSRRLKERINAAAFSRQALSMMHGGQPQGGTSVPNQGQQHVSQGQMDPAMMQQMMSTRFGGAAGMGTAQMQGLPQGFKGFDNQGGLPFNVNMQDPYGMPSNIQGAKTA